MPTRVTIRPLTLVLAAGLAFPLTARAQFVFTPQTTPAEWNATRVVQIGQNQYCLNNWNDGSAALPLCPPFPTINTDVVFPSGVTGFINSDASCNTLILQPGVSLMLASGTFRCLATDLASGFALNGGAIRDCAAFTIPQGLQLTLDTGSDKQIINTTLNTAGQTLWTNGAFYVNASTINNTGGWACACDSSLILSGIPSLFENTGAFTKTAGTGFTTVSTPFHTTGTVRAITGSINFSGPSLVSDAGDFEAFPGSTIQFAGPVTLNVGTTLRGEGAYRIAGNITTVNGLVLADNVALDSVLRIMDQSTLRIEYTLDWRAGSIGQSGTTGGVIDIIPPASAAISGGSDKSLVGTLFLNEGHTNWTAGAWYFSNGAVFENRNDFTITSGSSAIAAGGAPTMIHNTGLITKAAGSPTVFALPVVQAGHVRVATSELQFTGSSLLSTGAWTTDAGADVLFNSPSATLGAGTTLRGSGVYRNAGPLTIDASVPADRFEHLSGQLMGTGVLNIDRSILWTSGVIGSQASSLTVHVNPAASMSILGGSDKSLTSASLLLDGPATWSDGNLYFSSGCNVSNSSAWTCQSNNSLISAGGAPEFVNNGQFTKSSSTGVTTVAMPFTSHGTVTAHTGAIVFSGASAQLSGPVIADADASIVYAGPVALTSGAQLRSPGVHRVVQSTFTLQATVPAESFQLEGGTIVPSASTELAVSRGFTWLGGSVGVAGSTGSLHILPGATLEMRSPGDTSLNTASIVNDGSATWSIGNVYLSNGASFLNAASINITGDNAIINAGGAAPSFINTGQLTKLASVGFTSFSLPFTNAGTIRSTSGVIAFNNGFTQNSGRLSLAGGNFASAQPMTINSGSVDGAGAINGSVNNSGGVINPGDAPAAPGVLTITGAYTQSSSGELDIDITSSSPSGADRLAISGIATLSGTLRVNAAPNVTIPPNASWTILTAQDRRQAFASAVLPLGYSIEYTPTSVILHYTCPADFNHDTAVTSQDFFDYLTAFFGAFTSADLNHDNQVNSQDFFAFLTAFFSGC